MCQKLEHVKCVTWKVQNGWTILVLNSSNGLTQIVQVPVFIQFRLIRQISQKNFGNPNMAKIAVKWIQWMWWSSWLVQVMILLVDKNVTNSSLEASQGIFHWANIGSSGCHQVAARNFQCQKFGVKIQNLLMFEELWQPLVVKVTGIGSPM